ncbi:MAG: dihydroorotate dehydrogenase (quinone) [Phenylobacterium zucineum]|nr:MAG: dihydroorotate dehydrogenase (quinone) [Phenylobacterium zucineum]
MQVHDLIARSLHGLDPEDAHRVTLAGLALGLGPRTVADNPMLATEIAGISLPNCIGLAPGFDKNAEVFAPMLRAGFGFVECGTVTPLAQTGNPRPRLFRLTPDQAVINRMGFNNQGLDAFAARLTRRGSGIVGANIGANKDSEDRIADYVTGLERLWGLADYFTVNISSPNTPGLRGLQTRTALEELLGRLAEKRERLPAEGRSPIFLKVAPDLDSDEIEAVVETSVTWGLAGLIVSNTTLSRPDLRSVHAGESGGLSGAPLTELAQQKLKEFHSAAAGRLVLIGVGGIGSGAQAYARIRAGASAIQLYSALVFHGPGLVTRIARDLTARLKADGFTTVAQAVGVG